MGNSEVVRRVALAARRVASAALTTISAAITVVVSAAREARRVATTVAVKKSAKKFAPDRSLLPRRAASTPITVLPRAAITGSPRITTTGKLHLQSESPNQPCFVLCGVASMIGSLFNSRNGRKSLALPRCCLCTQARGMFVGDCSVGSFLAHHFFVRYAEDCVAIVGEGGFGVCPLG